MKPQEIALQMSQGKWVRVSDFIATANIKPGKASVVLGTLQQNNNSMMEVRRKASGEIVSYKATLIDHEKTAIQIAKDRLALGLQYAPECLKWRTAA